METQQGGLSTTKFENTLSRTTFVVNCPDIKQLRGYSLGGVRLGPAVLGPEWSPVHGGPHLVDSHIHAILVNKIPIPFVDREAMDRIKSGVRRTEIASIHHIIFVLDNTASR